MDVGNLRPSLRRHTRINHNPDEYVDLLLLEFAQGALLIG
jgi:hypothetical protein